LIQRGKVHEFKESGFLTSNSEQGLLALGLIKTCSSWSLITSFQILNPKDGSELACLILGLRRGKMAWKE
jgi:hypothetical protein